MKNLSNFSNLLDLANKNFHKYTTNINPKEHLNIALLYLNDALSMKIDYSVFESHQKNKLKDALILRAKIFFNFRDYLKCINDCNYAEKINKKEHLIYSIRGDAKFELNKFQEAIYDYETGIELKPNDCILFLNKGIAEFELANFKEAINCFIIAKKRISKYSSNYELLKMYMILAQDYANYENKNFLKIIYEKKY